MAESKTSELNARISGASTGTDTKTEAQSVPRELTLPQKMEKLWNHFKTENPDKSDDEISIMMYRYGAPFKRTYKEGANDMKIVLLIEGVLYTFVDVPGEIFSDDAGMSSEAIDNQYPAIKVCDAFLTCVSPSDVSGNTQNINGAFYRFMNFLPRPSAPVLYLLVQADLDGMSINASHSADSKERLMELWDEVPPGMTLGANDRKSMLKFIKEQSADGPYEVIKNSDNAPYISTLCCSAYGFKPDAFDETGSNQNPPAPKYIKAIIQWLRIILGAEEYKFYNPDLHKKAYRFETPPRREYKNLTDEKSLAIVEVFDNPLESDRAYYNDSKDGLITAKNKRTPFSYLTKRKSWRKAYD